MNEKCDEHPTARYTIHHDRFSLRAGARERCAIAVHEMMTMSYFRRSGVVERVSDRGKAV